MQAINKTANDPAGAHDPLTTRAYSPRHLFRGSVALTISIMAALLVQPFQAFAASAPPPALELYVAPTGQTIQGGFLQTFQKYGLAVIGYPLTPEISEGGRTVQYFERVRMEYHPELASQGEPVLFTRLGADISAGSPFGGIKSFQSSAGRVYFDQTSHSLGEPFLSFWRNSGGLALFGYPISEVIRQDGMQVQWFERARMEYHPELVSKGYGVELTLLGSIAYKRSHNLSAAAAGPSQMAMNGMEAGLLAGVNAQRAAAGVPPVTVMADLTSFAHWRSSDMASRNYFSHTTPEGKNALQLLTDRGISYSLAGEILEKNSYDEAHAVGEAVSNFMQSPPHRAIMLDGRYTQVGVGFAQGSGGMNYFTVVFVRR